MDPRERLDDPQDAIRTAIAGALASVFTALPGVVTKVNLDPLTVEVQPTVKAVIEQRDGTYQAVAYPVLVDVPVVFQQGGGAVLTFPVMAGDECLVVFSARCIDTWWQQGGVQLPNVSRSHSLSDGFALVGPFSQPARFSNWSATTVQLRSKDGACLFELDPANNKARIVAPGGLEIVGDVSHEGNLSQTGNTVQTGTISASGVIHSEDDVTAHYSLNGHVHGGVKIGDSFTTSPR